MMLMALWWIDWLIDWWWIANSKGKTMIPVGSLSRAGQYDSLYKKPAFIFVLTWHFFQIPVNCGIAWTKYGTTGHVHSKVLHWEWYTSSSASKGQTWQNKQLSYANFVREQKKKNFSFHSWEICANACYVLHNLTWKHILEHQKCHKISSTRSTFTA